MFWFGELKLKFFEPLFIEHWSDNFIIRYQRFALLYIKVSRSWFLQAFWSQVMDEGQLANIDELHLKERNTRLTDIFLVLKIFQVVLNPSDSVPLRGSSCTSASLEGYSSNLQVVSETKNI